MHKRGFSHASHLMRFREVASILVKYGFGFIFDRFTRRRLKNTEADYDHPTVDGGQPPNMARSLRKAFEELGPTFVKLGQLLSVRPDLLGPEYIREFEKLQNDVPAFSYEEVLQVFSEESLSVDSFADFDPVPMAAASMAQVHEAILLTGEKVVVKIQRPGIERQVEMDLEIMTELAGLLEKRTKWGRFYRVTELVEEIGQALRNELDFSKEARNADIFYKNFAQNPLVRIPKVYWQYSTRRVLTLEYIDGIKVSDLMGLRKADYNTERIAKHLVDALFKQVYEDGFFHADPHPGNIAIAEGEVVIFYDFGQVGVVDNVLREKCVNLLISMMRYDSYAVTRTLLEIGIGSQRVNREEFRRDVSRLQSKYYGMPIADINVGEALEELLDLSIKHQIRLPAELSLLVKMLMTVESMVTQLDPTLSIVDMAEPYGKKVLLKKMSPGHARDSIKEVILDYAALVQSMPRDLDHILKQLAEGDLKINMEHINLKRLISRLDIMSNRLSLAVILASIIIGSSLVVDNSRSKILEQIPLVEGGFIIALILGLFLVYSIIRSGRY